MARKKSNIIDLNKIKQDLDKAIQAVGKEVGDEIQSAFETALDYFYGGYYPRNYGRTESLLKASSAANGIPTYKKNGEMSCEAGIVVDSSFMPAGVYSKSHGWKNPSVDAIFSRAWNEGIHGFTAGEVAGTWLEAFAPPQTQPAAPIMEKEFNKIKKSIGKRIGALFSI